MAFNELYIYVTQNVERNLVTIVNTIFKLRIIAFIISASVEMDVSIILAISAGRPEKLDKQNIRNQHMHDWIILLLFFSLTNCNSICFGSHFGFRRI